MDKRTDHNNNLEDSAPFVVAELLGLGLSANTLYDGVSDDCPCCQSAGQEVALAA